MIPLIGIQFYIVPSLYSIGDDRSPLHSPWKSCDPLNPATPSPPPLVKLCIILMIPLIGSQFSIFPSLYFIGDDKFPPSFSLKILWSQNPATNPPPPPPSPLQRLCIILMIPLIGSQFSIVPSLYSVSDDRSPLHSPWKSCDPQILQPTPPPSPREYWLVSK